MYKDVDVGAIVEVVDGILDCSAGTRKRVIAVKELKRYFVPFPDSLESSRDKLIIVWVRLATVFDGLAVWCTGVPNNKPFVGRGMLFDEEQETLDFVKEAKLPKYYDLQEQITYLVAPSN